MCHAVCLVEESLILDDGTLHLRHASHDSHHRLLVGEAERCIGLDARCLAHEADVSLGIVAVAARCPTGYDLADGIGVVQTDVVADEHEGGTIAVLASGELYESTIALTGCHALPLVGAVADVKRIVVTDASGLYLCVLASCTLGAPCCFA